MLLGSLDKNYVGVEGAKAIAAVLKDAQLSTLRCAPQSRAIPADT